MRLLQDLAIVVSLLVVLANIGFTGGSNPVAHLWSNISTQLQAVQR